MAKKEDDGMGEGFMKSMGIDFIYTTSKKMFQSFLETISDSVYEMTKRLSHFIVSYMLFLAGLAFVIISVILLAKEYLQISYGWSTLVFGIVFMLIALIMRVSIKKKGEK